MDEQSFDHLTKSFSVATTRRVPLLVLLSALFALRRSGADVAGKSRGKRRTHGRQGETHHKVSAAKKGQQKKGKKKHRKKCKLESRLVTCAGKCGAVQNNCKKTVDCGSCACDNCPICRRCNAASRTCVTDESAVGGVCGPEQVCQADGRCSCDSTTCTRPGETCGGGGTPGICGCTPQRDVEACAGQICGTVMNYCGVPVNCTGCTGCCDGDQCLDGDAKARCGKDGAPCQICAPFAICESQRCQAGPRCGDAEHGPCRVFVTSTSRKGDIGSVEAADEICQSHAAEAGLPGTYQAWLSSDLATGKSPATRFLTKSVGPYWLVDGTPIANDWADLTSGSLAASIAIDEHGTRVEVHPFYAWTNTQSDGNVGHDVLSLPDYGLDYACQNWSDAACAEEGFIGWIYETNQGWTSAEVYGECCQPYRLYCFQQG